MPQGEWEKSLVANGYPLLPDDAQIVLQDDVGVDNPLDANEVSIVPRRELVSLDNASVNIDNSNDVIIGPVTQFNVTGNVIIRQRENERPSQGEDNEGDGVKSKTGALKVKPTISRILQTILNHTMQNKTRTILIAITVIIIVTAVIIFLVLHHGADNGKNHKPDRVGNYSMYSKDLWGGKEPTTTTPLPLPIGLVVISHSVTNPCNSFESCSLKVRTIQNNQLGSGLSDICYNFLIGGDGSIFVGRGWETKNCHSKLSIGISFIGDHSKVRVNASTIESTLELLDLGVELGNLTEDYMLVGHNQTANTQSPGKFAYEEIKKFPHFRDIDLK